MPFSVYNYLNPTELAQYIHTMAAVSNQALAASFISDAERVIDAFAGPSPPYYTDLTGTTAATMAPLQTDLTATLFGDRRPAYWARGGVYIHVVSSSEASIIGERRLVVNSAGTNTITLASGFATSVPSGTQFDYRQESVFPRIWDRTTLSDPRLPDMLLKPAVAAQVEYGIDAGSEAFGLSETALVTDKDGSVLQRSYGSGFSESRDAARTNGLALWIAPKARVFMRRLLNSTGYIR